MKELLATRHLYFAFLILMAGCSSGNERDAIVSVTDSVKTTVDSVPVVPVHTADMVISDIPFPFQVLETIYTNKIPFSADCINSPEAVSNYNQYNSKAINLGIYGADLAYVVTYEQFQQIGTYVKTTKKLAEDLSIPIAFDQPMMEKYSKFKDNKDSLKKVVYDSYTKVDEALKNNERVGMAALVVAGSWLEGLYISSHATLNAGSGKENKELYSSILEQKKSLQIVVKLLQEYQSDPFFSSLINDLGKITKGYDQISSDSDMNKIQLTEIHKQVGDLRKKLIQGK